MENLIIYDVIGDVMRRKTRSVARVPAQVPADNVSVQQGASWLAICAMVLGLVPILAMFFKYLPGLEKLPNSIQMVLFIILIALYLLGPFFALAAIVLGVLAFRQGSRLGIVGIVVGILAFLFLLQDMLAIGIPLIELLFTQPAQPSPELIAKAELVMTPGMEIVADTAHGKLVIGAGEGTERTYSWDDSRCVRKAVHWPRSDRWYGSLGMYDPAIRGTSCQVYHAVAEEAQMHFQSVPEAQAWLAGRREPLAEQYLRLGSFSEVVYSDTGLVVDWTKASRTTEARELIPGQFSMDFNVWQILINGNKPDKLEGSRNDKITVS
ncbi:hypothetical protein HY490_05415 [Candidatus Woesearchaeota archaeon]|nr:hypothetical protein [Candidatus Woesearchaeota archaeon]